MSVLSRAMSGVESIRSPAGGGANNTGQNMAPSREGAFGSVEVRRFANQLIWHMSAPRVAPEQSS